MATVSTGPVTGFGSVFVSGNEFATNGTSFTVDGIPNASERQLKKGMIILVNGTITEDYKTNQVVQRTARTILYEDTIEGPVQFVAPDGLSLIVLGQTVLINQSTIIDPSVPAISSLKQNDLVEVSGFVSGPGTVVATLIDRKNSGEATNYQVKGFISQHDDGRQSFTLGSLEVNYTGADISQMPNPAGTSWDGRLVDVQGSQVKSGGSGPYGIRLTATKVKPETLRAENSESTEIEGFVSQISAPGHFYLGNVPVQTSAGTTFEGGTINDILVGAHLEVYGSLVGGIVNATNVEFEGETELQANVAAINATDSTLTLTGLPALAIQFDSQTALQGQGNPHSLTDLQAGDHLKIHGQLRGGDMILATEVERSAPASTVQIKGLVMSAADPFLVLFGSSIDTSSIPENRFLGRSGVIGRSGFFTGLSSGEKIVLRGTYQANTVTWSSVSRGD
ncbi:MAG: DUF5666 domain-containing protein [Nitrospirota bacterium]|nr:DUF5666 domain-containing protein [Nitrospirota bacterium]